MKINKLFHLTCSEAMQFCDKSEYREASFIEKLKLQLHFAICKTCKKYHDQNTRLTSLIREAGIQTRTKTEKEKLRREFDAVASKIPKK